MGKQFAQTFLALQAEAQNVQKNMESKTLSRASKNKTLSRQLSKSIRGTDIKGKTLSKCGDFLEELIKDTKYHTSEAQAKTIRSKYNLTQKDVSNQRGRVRSMLPKEFLENDNQSNEMQLYDIDIEDGKYSNTSSPASSTRSSSAELTRSQSRQTLVSMLDEQTMVKSSYKHYNQPTISKSGGAAAAEGFQNTLGKNTKKFSKNTAKSAKNGTKKKLPRQSSSLDDKHLDFKMFDRANGSVFTDPDHPVPDYESDDA